MRQTTKLTPSLGFWTTLRVINKIQRQLNLQPSFIPFLRDSKLLVGPNWTSNFHEIFVRNLYSPIRELSHKPNILDLGGFVGYASTYFALTNPSASIRVVEANPYTLLYLQQQLEQFAKTHQIDILHTAIADNDPSIAFRIDRNNPCNIASNAFRDMEYFHDKEQFFELTVQTTPLEDLLFDYTDFMKVDVEGAEYLFLNHPEIKPSRVGQLWVEFHDVQSKREHFESTVKTLLDRNYELYSDNSEKVINRADFFRSVQNQKADASVLSFVSK